MILYKYEIHIISNQRGGTHAIGNWLLGLYDTAVYKNDADFDLNKGMYKFSLYKNGSFVKDYEIPPRADAILISHENCVPENISKIYSDRRYIESVERILKSTGAQKFSDCKKIVAVARDTYNNTASALKLFGQGELTERIIQNNICFLKEWASKTKFLANLDHTFVSFNKWFMSEDYRRKISDYLNIPYNELNLLSMMHYGSGSSFSSLDNHQSANKLNVLNRYQNYLDNPYYIQKLTSSDEIYSLNSLLFGISPSKFAPIINIKSTRHDKLWGYEEWIDNNNEYCSKKLVLKKQHQCSYHYHMEKLETFYVEDGVVLLEVYDKIHKMVKGDILRIPRYAPHRFLGVENSVIFEFSTQHFEYDSYRLYLSRKLDNEEFIDKVQSNA